MAAPLRKKWDAEKWDAKTRDMSHSRCCTTGRSLHGSLSATLSLSLPLPQHDMHPTYHMLHVRVYSMSNRVSGRAPASPQNCANHILAAHCFTASEQKNFLLCKNRHFSHHTMQYKHTPRPHREGPGTGPVECSYFSQKDIFTARAPPP